MIIISIQLCWCNTNVQDSFLGYWKYYISEAGQLAFHQYDDDKIHDPYASERSTFSFIGVIDGSSALDGWDSSFAAACNTRFWTSKDEGEVESPMPLVSNFPAIHEYATAPTLAGPNNNLMRGYKDGTKISLPVAEIRSSAFLYEETRR